MELTIESIAAAVSGRVLQGGPRRWIEGVSTDSRTIRPGELFIPLKGEHFDGHAFIGQAVRSGAPAILVSGDWKREALPELPSDTSVIAVADTLTALGDLARAWAQDTTATIIAITGSNGKTTTREMTATILERSCAVLKPRCNWNNLIGLPLTLLELRPRHRIAVLELGMNRRGEIKRLAQIAQPRIGVITNIGPVHLEHLKTLEEVARAKGELFESLGSSSHAVINADDPRVAALAGLCTAQTITFGITAPAQVRALDITSPASGENRFTLVIGSESVPVSLRSPGIHSVYNALAAASIASLCGTDIQEIKAGLETHTSFPGRMEIIRLDDGITIINDTYNANPTSMEIALTTLANLKGTGRGIAVLGDMLELGEASEAYHRQLGSLITTLKINAAILTGAHAHTVAAGARERGTAGIAVSIADTHEEIARRLDRTVQPHDWILFKGSRGMGMEKSMERFMQLRNAHAGMTSTAPAAGMGCNH
jgi:UDP-N-acetylmuramoyl-tripeptide--D-alanyl-D-alanine ligase